ncbi:MAG: thioesterase family protein [Candidatus Omnitrophica bacterium]|nr:thioesterase family protein [Candidatus Omnitrophota bacterium]MDD5351707.1 thioesterase family protein [Candidatus Omnitrophota bacterium]MDD5550917.1 thioesterase family protein [Candidatus Omnitrophota bacterium]
MSKEFSAEVRVTYADTDQMGVVYYANYFVWLEIARTEFLRFFGVDYRNIEKEKKLALPVIEAYCKYKAPARYDEIIVIKTKVTQIKNSTLRFDYDIFSKDSNELLAVAYTTHVFIDKQRRPVRIPEAVKEIL